MKMKSLLKKQGSVTSLAPQKPKRRRMSIRKLVNRPEKIEEKKVKNSKKLKSVLTNLSKNKKKLLRLPSKDDFIQGILVQEEQKRKIVINRKLKRAQSLSELFKLSSKNALTVKKSKKNHKNRFLISATNSVDTQKKRHKRSKSKYGEVLGSIASSKLENIDEIMGVVRGHRKQKSVDVDNLIDTEFKRCMNINTKMRKSVSFVTSQNSKKRKKKKIKPLNFENIDDIRIFEKGFRDVFVTREQKTRNKIKDIFEEKGNPFELKKRKKKKKMTKIDILDKEHKQAILRLEIANMFSCAEKGVKATNKLTKGAKGFLRELGVFNEHWAHISLSSSKIPVKIIQSHNIQKIQKNHENSKIEKKLYEKKFQSDHLQSKFDQKFVVTKEALQIMKNEKRKMGEMYDKEIQDEERGDYRPIDYVEKTKTLKKAIGRINVDLNERNSLMKREGNLGKKNVITEASMNLMLAVKESQHKKVLKILDEFPELKFHRDNVSFFYRG